MASFNDMYPSKFLKKEDVPTPRIVRITGIGRSKVGGDDGEEKNILYFDGLKEMVLNKANGYVLFEAFGEPDNWPGKSIEVFSDPSVMFAGKRVGGLRLRYVAQQIAAPPASEVWTIEEALRRAESAGITKDDLRAALAAKGHDGWRAERDTPVLKAMIAAKPLPALKNGDVSF